MSCAFCYYGLVLMSTELFGAGPNINNLNAGEANDCHPLATTDYMDLLWTTLAEFPGIFATIFIIEKCGRKKTMAFQFLLYAGCIAMLTTTGEWVALKHESKFISIEMCMFFLCFAWSSRTALTIILFLARGVIAGLFQAAYVYTPEVYPTALRSVGVGGCSALARLGAMATPYVAQVLLQTSLTSAVTVYGIFAVSACIACLLLPYETRGSDMAN